MIFTVRTDCRQLPRMPRKCSNVLPPTGACDGGPPRIVVACLVQFKRTRTSSYPWTNPLPDFIIPSPRLDKSITITPPSYSQHPGACLIHEYLDSSYLIPSRWSEYQSFGKYIPGNLCNSKDKLVLAAQAIHLCPRGLKVIRIFTN